MVVTATGRPAATDREAHIMKPIAIESNVIFIGIIGLIRPVAEAASYLATIKLRHTPVGAPLRNAVERHGTDASPCHRIGALRNWHDSHGVMD